MKGLKYFIVALVLIALASCKQDEYNMFSDVARIQMGSDTTQFLSFVYGAPTKMQDTVFFDVNTIGNTSTKDRSFTLQQVQFGDASINAVPGTDYKAFTDPTVSSAYVIKAGKVTTRIPIVLLRTVALKTSTKTLKFTVVENSNFKLGLSTSLSRKVIFTDQLSKPIGWTVFLTTWYLGEYSKRKLQFMIDVTGLKWDEAFLGPILNDRPYFTFIIGFLKAQLYSYNVAHPGNPMVDENGNVVVFP